MPIQLQVTNQTSLAQLQEFLNQGENKAKIYGKDEQGITTLYLKPKAKGLAVVGDKIKSMYASMTGKAATRRDIARNALQGIMVKFNKDMVSQQAGKLNLNLDHHKVFREALDTMLDGIQSQTIGNHANETKANRVLNVKLYAATLIQLRDQAKILDRNQPEPPPPVPIGLRLNQICNQHQVPVTTCEPVLTNEEGKKAEGNTQVTSPPNPFISGKETLAVATPITIDGTRYLPVKYLARGGFGDVFQYKAENSNRIIAVKISNSANQNALEGALKEIENHARLSNTSGNSVVRLLGAVQQPGTDRIAIATEFAPHGDVNELAMKVNSRIAKDDKNPQSGEITKQQAKVIILTLLEDMAKGLHSIHQDGGLTHYDFKTPNVLIDENGIGKVTDFGTTFEGGTIHFSETTAIESAGYKAPEIAYASKRYDESGKQIEKEVTDGIRDLRKNFGLIYPDLNQDDLDTFVERVTVERKEVAMLDRVNPKMENVGKADVWGLGASAYQLFTGKLILSGFDKYESLKDVRLSEFSQQIEGKAIASMGFQGNIFEKSLAHSTGDPKLDDFINWVLAPNPKDRPTAEDIKNHDIFLANGIGSDQARALIKAIAQDKVDGIDNARIELK